MRNHISHLVSPNGQLRATKVYPDGIIKYQPTNAISLASVEATILSINPMSLCQHGNNREIVDKRKTEKKIYVYISPVLLLTNLVCKSMLL
jgi:hypothetical protein